MSRSIRALLVVACVLLALAAVYFARTVMVPFLLAAVIAYTLSPIVSALERRGIPRSWGALIVMVGMALALSALVVAAVPELVRQVRHFGDRLPGYLREVQSRLEPLEAYLRERYPEQLEAIRTQAADNLRGVLPALAGWAAAGVRGALTSVARLIVWLLTIVVVPVFAYYLMAGYPEIRATVESLIPARLRPEVDRRVDEIDRVLRAWLKAQLSVALVLAAIYAVGLTLLGVPLGLLIGVVGGLANMVPYLGLVAGFVPAALLAFLDTGSWSSPLMVAGVFLMGQLIEGTILSPRIIGGGLGLPPALVLLSVLVGGELFGFTGLLLSVPATAAGLVLLRNLRRSYDASPLEADAVGRPAAPRAPVRRRRPRP